MSRHRRARAVGFAADAVQVWAVLMIGSPRPWLVALAAVTTVATLALLVVTVRAERPRGRVEQTEYRDRRRHRHRGARDPREALELVGNALAATHNPRALMPVILEVITEATGARGARLIEGGNELGWIGDAGPSNDDALALELGAGDEVECPTLLLYPPQDGFPQETRELAEWLASQAAIALENARLHHVVQHQAVTDELTGLVNRRRFLEALSAEIERSGKEQAPLSLVLADLDDFKQVNDRFGHHAGDELLRAFAQLIRDELRDVDTSGRIGGEEFAILLPDTDVEEAARVAERTRRALSDLRPSFAGGHRLARTASFGIAQLEANESGDELMRRADAALYRAKALGKNRVSLDETSRR